MGFAHSKPSPELSARAMLCPATLGVKQSHAAAYALRVQTDFQVHPVQSPTAKCLKRFRM
jgi:hypothetical protein